MPGGGSGRMPEEAVEEGGEGSGGRLRVSSGGWLEQTGGYLYMGRQRRKVEGRQWRMAGADGRVSVHGEAKEEG